MTGRPEARSELGEHLIVGRDAGARVEQEQHEVGLGECGFRLLAHAFRDRAALCFFQPRSIHQRHGIAGEVQLRPRAGRASRPGMSETSAERFPVSRLNSVDLPTLGRPMMAMTGVGMCALRLVCFGTGGGGRPGASALIAHSPARW